MHISQRKVRERIWNKTDGVCYYCGAQTKPFMDFCIDHMFPISKYPEMARDIENLNPCCQKCNCEKKDKTLEEYRNYLAVKRGIDKYMIMFAFEKNVEWFMREQKYANRPAF